MTTETAPCQKCREEINTGAERCPSCGYEPQRWRKFFGMRGTLGICRRCGEKIEGGNIRCPECGYLPSAARRIIGWSFIGIGAIFCLSVLGIFIGLPLMAIGFTIKSPAKASSIEIDQRSITATGEN